MLAARGCGGFVVAGSTGEGPYLTIDERTSLVTETRAQLPDSYVIAGINAESTRQALTQIGAAADAGADAVLVLTPTTLVRGNVDSVTRFYSAVADESGVPVLLYSNPKVTAYELPTSAISKLAAHPNVAGIKDSGGDPTRIDDIASEIEAGFVVYPGASRALLASAQKGAYGAITASANYVYPLVAGAAAGEADAQRSLDAVIAVVEQHGIAGAKAAAEAAGLQAGSPRAPLTPVSDAGRSEIRVAVANAQQR